MKKVSFYTNEKSFICTYFTQKFLKHLSVMLCFKRIHQKNLLSPSPQPKVPFDEVH